MTTKLYHAIKDGKVVSRVQEDHDKLEGWKLQHPVWILQEEVDRQKLLKVENGIIVIDEKLIEEKTLAQSKATHEQNAYAQQNAYFNANKKAIFDAVVYNSPPSDMSILPKINTYKIFMQSLWTEYHTRIATSSADFDYTLIKPSIEYSYVELEEEWVNYNAL